MSFACLLAGASRARFKISSRSFLSLVCMFGFFFLLVVLALTRDTLNDSKSENETAMTTDRARVREREREKRHYCHHTADIE